jgi:pSer/pThr/pTyr-binding forkhead associated (FHA) protein
MSPFALSMLKFGLLVLLYLFIWRAVRSVSSGLRSAPAGAGPPARAASRPKRQKRPPRGAGRTPTSVTLKTQQGKKVGSYKLTDTMEVGRADSCAIHLSDTYASQQHARLFGRDGSWFVEDLGSTNGTYVNDRRIESPSQVRSGDRIRIGTTVLELHS